jgi:hypothetical protein
VGPYIQKAQNRLKGVTVPLFYRGHWYYFQSACGITGLGLNEWFRQTSKFPGTHILTLGDDAIIYDSFAGKWVELDYSKFDQSQRGIYIDLDLEILHALGVPRHVLPYLDRLAELPMIKKYKTRNCVIKFHAHEKHRKSGSPDTSLSNTTKNWVILLASLARLREMAENFQEDYATVLERALPLVIRQFGVDVVCTVSDTFRNRSFLRGLWWLGDDGEFHWCYVPAMVLKLGKIGRNVRTQHEMRQLASGLSRSYGMVPRNMPILGPFLEKMDDLSYSPLDNEKEIQNMLWEEKPWMEHRPKVETFSLDRQYALEILEERYGITPEQVTEVEKMIREVESLPWYLGHEVFQMLQAEFL